MPRVRAIKLNYDVVLTIFAEPSLWRAKIFEKNQDDPKNKNHKSTCTALKPISVIRKKKNTFYYLSFSFEINILLTGFNMQFQNYESQLSWIILTNSNKFSMSGLLSFFRPKQSIWLVIKLAKIQDSHDSEFVVGSGEQNTI